MLARRNMAHIAGVICSVHTQSGNWDGDRRASMPQRTATAAPPLKMERNHPAGLSFASCDAEHSLRAIASRLRQPPPCRSSMSMRWTQPNYGLLARNLDLGFLLHAIQLGHLLAQCTHREAARCAARHRSTTH